MEYVIKRNGVKALFDKSKIVNAIEKARDRCSAAYADHRKA